MNKAEDLNQRFFVKGSDRQLANIANNKEVNKNKLSQAALNQIVAKINSYSNDKEENKNGKKTK